MTELLDRIKKEVAALQDSPMKPPRSHEILDILDLITEWMEDREDSEDDMEQE